jgi:hypothetical protein
MSIRDRISGLGPDGVLEVMVSPVLFSALAFIPFGAVLTRYIVSEYAGEGKTARRR